MLPNLTLSSDTGPGITSPDDNYPSDDHSAARYYALAGPVHAP